MEPTTHIGVNHSLSRKKSYRPKDILCVDDLVRVTKSLPVHGHHITPMTITFLWRMVHELISHPHCMSISTILMSRVCETEASIHVKAKPIMHIFLLHIPSHFHKIYKFFPIFGKSINPLFSFNLRFCLIYVFCFPLF